MTDNNYNAGYNLGAQIACAVNNKPAGEAIKAAAFNSAIINDIQMQGDLCKVACAILDNAGEVGSEAFMLYKSASETIARGEQLTKTAAEAFLFPVVEALDAAAKRVHEEVMEKSAGIGLVNFFGKLFGTAGKGMALTDDIYNKLLALSIGVGGSGGALAWYLNRDANQDEADTETKLEQAKHYRRIAEDIKSRLASNSSNIQNAAKEQSNSSYLM